MKRLITAALLLISIIALGFVGCSDDDSTNPTSNNTNNTGGDHFDVTFTQFTGIVEEVAPPVYQAPAGAPQGEWDSMWTDGSYPLLGKVFGEDEPMSLYWNLEQLDDAIIMLDEIADKLDSMGVTGDTLIAVPGGGQVDYREMTTATSIPTDAQDVMGFSSLDLDNVFLFDFTDGTDTGHYHLGYTATDTTQTYLTWFSAEWSANPGVVESFLYYAHVNLTDSTVDIKGAFYKDYGNQTSARWVYDIVTAENANFDYRMSWFSDESPEFSLLGCVLGGGNKDTQFALKYRQFSPADTTVMDSTFLLEQMFNADYDYLGEITTAYEDYVDEADIFTLDYVPTALIPSPWEE